MPVPPMSTVDVFKYTLAIGAAWLVYHVLKALYNVSPFHPLAKIPGPKLAAATYLPEFYFDVVLGGRYTHAIQRMHEEYGPVVRINPNEMHCNDIAFADEIYAVGSRKRNKPLHQINGTAGGNLSAFSTPDHDLHRVRRAPIARFFSPAMIAQLEDELRVLVDKLCAKLLAQRAGTPFDVAMAYSCFTSDAISGYSFGESFGLLDQPDWTPNFRQATLAVLKPVFVFRFFPFLRELPKLTSRFARFFPADVALLMRTMGETVPQHVAKAQRDVDAGVHYERATIFQTLLESDLAAGEKTAARLHADATAVLGAGTETTSWVLTVVTFHLLAEPAQLARLRAALAPHVPDPRALPPGPELEAHVPYLAAVVLEGLRLSYGVSARTAREPAPQQPPLVYRGEFRKRPVELVLPSGYAVGMSAVLAHHDETLFPDSRAFRPERWLDDRGERRRDLEKGLLAFSKGSRACLGKNLALAELHLALAALALRVLPHMRLYETTERDVAYDHDMFIPMVAPGSKGVRVVME